VVQKGGRFLSGLWVIPGLGSRERITDIPAYYHKLRNFGSLEMVNSRINAHGGFTHAAMAPPNAIDHERYYVIITQRGGGMRGQARSPLSSYQCFVFHIIAKTFLQTQNFILT